MNDYLIICYFIYLVFFFIISKCYNLKIPNSIIYAPFLIAVAFSRTPDTQPYKDFFLLVDCDLTNLYGTEFAAGFQILTKIVKLLVGTNFSMYIFTITLINTLVIIFSLNVLLKNFTNKDDSEQFEYDILLALIMYFTYFGLYYNSIAIRANYAITIIYLILAIMDDGKFHLKRVLFILTLLLVATLFHSTAILGLIILLIYLLINRLSHKIYIGILIFVGIFYFSGLSQKFVYSFLDLNLFEFILNSFYNEGIAEIARYSKNVDISNTLSIKFLFQYLISFILIFPKNQPSTYYKYLNIYIVGIIIYALFGSMQSVTRVQDFFAFSLFILSWLYIRKLESISLSVIMCIFMIAPQLLFILRIINNY